MALFRIFFWPQRVLFLGPAFSPGLHQHGAAHWCFGVHAPVRVRASRAAPWQEHVSFYVPPSKPHEVVSHSELTVFLYLEPESTELAEACARLPTPQEITPTPIPQECLQTLATLTRPQASICDAERISRKLLGLPEHDATRTRSAGEAPHYDPRLARCLREIHASLEGPLRLASLAARVGVSESWLMHRFTAEVGVPLRRYVLWQRLRRALEMALHGATLTEAAHATGMSDGAHLSRTFKSAFGITPSFLFEHREHVVASFAPSARGADA